jgi:ATP-binding protein involved in chromosome partitioning
MAQNPIAGQVLAALQSVEIPGGGRLADYQGLSEVIVTPSAVAFAISVEPGMEGAFGPARAAATEAAQAASEGRKVMVSLTADRAPANAGQGGAAPQQRQAAPAKTGVDGIRNIVPVASGKGGVGKSTCSVNLALALSAQGLKVGLLDADLYGPSVPKLLGLEGKPAVREDGIFMAHEAHGIKAISIGSMLAKDQAVVWRGPMASSALRQLLRETEWGELDVLIVDLPPGTGDIQISLCQQVELDGAVIVSTPQDLALIDARKAIDMFARLSIRLLGLIENMSYFVAPDTGTRYDIFGHGGAQAAAGELGMPFLGEVPLHMDVRAQSDAGVPIVVAAPESAEAQAFMAIAEKIKTALPNKA